MFRYSKTPGLAALFVLVSAALHILAPLVGSFGWEAIQLVPIGLAYVAIGYYLGRNLRWLAWITFFIMLFGGIVALGGAMGMSGVPGWWYALIVIANWLAAAMLFGFLWHSKPVVR